MWFSACLAAILLSQSAPATAGFHVSGRVRASNDERLLSGAVIMSRVGVEAAEPASGTQGRIEPDGSFRFAGVPPGRYLVRARAETGRNRQTLFATFAVTVTSTDITGIELTLSPGAAIEGRLTFQSRHGLPLPSLDGVRVRAPLADGAAFGDTLTGTPDPDGRFRLAGLMPGTHVLMVEGLPFPWRLSEARLRGLDAVEHGFELDRAVTIGNVGLIVTDTAAGVRGAIARREGNGALDVVVVALPASPLRRRLPLRFVRSQRTTAPGTYRLLDLVAGDHLVVAVTGIDEADLLRPDVLDALAELGVPVTLRETAIGTADLEPTALAAPRHD